MSLLSGEKTMGIVGKTKSKYLCYTRTRMIGFFSLQI